MDSCQQCQRVLGSADRGICEEGDTGLYCIPCRLAMGKKTEEEPLPPVVLAVDRYNEGRFVFRCVNPQCKKELAVRRVVFDEIVVCRYKNCRTEMRLITERQRRSVLRQKREQKEDADRIRASGGVALPDQIVVLGRPQSGKTVYLTVLYRNLWRATGDLSACSSDGDSHKMLLEQYASMRDGQWPDGGQGTLDLRHHDWDVQYAGSTLHLSTMDYPGEVYRKVFFEKRIDQPECLTLFRQVDSAMAVMLLVDPSQVVEDEMDVVDLEFSCVQVAQHLKEKGLADNFMIVLTKHDRNARLVERHGGPWKFVRRYLPRLAETAPTARVVSLCAMPEARDDQGAVLLSPLGQTIPQPSSGGEPHVLIPLRRLLDGIDPEHLRNLAEMDAETSRRASASPSPDLRLYPNGRGNDNGMAAGEREYRDQQSGGT